MKPLKNLGFNKEIGVLIYSQFFLWILYYSFNPYISSLLTYNGVNQYKIGFLISIRAVSYIIGMLLGGAIADAFGYKKTTIYSLMASAVLCFVVSVLLGYTTLLIFVMAVLGFFNGIAFSSESALIINKTHSGNRMVVFNMMRIMINLSLIIYPFFINIFFLKHYSLMFVLSGAVYGIYGLVLKHRIADAADRKQSILSSLLEYKKIICDTKFILMFVIVVLSCACFSFVDTALPMYLKVIDVHYIRHYHIILFINSYLSLILQILLIKYFISFNDLRVFITGNIFYALGFLLILFHVTLFISIGCIIVGKVFVAPSGFSILMKNKSNNVGKYITVANFRLLLSPMICGIIIMLCENYPLNIPIYFLLLASMVTIFLVVICGARKVLHFPKLWRAELNEKINMS